MDYDQGVWNRREIQLTRLALPYDYTFIAIMVLHLKKSFQDRFFNLLNLVFYCTILNKTNFGMYGIEDI